MVPVDCWQWPALGRVAPPYFFGLFDTVAVTSIRLEIKSFSEKENNFQGCVWMPACICYGCPVCVQFGG